MVKIEFKNFHSKDDFLLESYFKEYQNVILSKTHPAVVQGKLRDTLNHMVESGICTEDVEINLNSESNLITLDSKKRGISVGTTLNTDKSQQTTGSIINLFGKGGKLGVNFSFDILRKLNCEVSYSDRFQNKLTMSKITQPTVYPEKSFKLDEEHFTFQFPQFLFLGKPNLLSIYGGNRKSLIDDNKNQYNEHKSHTSITSKLSLTHIVKFFNCDTTVNPSKGYFGRVQNEIAIPILSDCSFLKSSLTTTLIYPLIHGVRLHFTNNIGGIFKFNKNIMTPYSDRFFNDKAFTIEGFSDSSLITSKSNTPYLGGDYFFTSSISLVKPFSDNFNFFCFGTMGNASLNQGSLKSSLQNLFDTKRLRSSIGTGLFIDAGQAFVKISIVKPFTNIESDSKKIFGFDFQVKF